MSHEIAVRESNSQMILPVEADFTIISKPEFFKTNLNLMPTINLMHIIKLRLSFGAKTV